MYKGLEDLAVPITTTLRWRQQVSEALVHVYSVTFWSFPCSFMSLS